MSGIHIPGTANSPTDLRLPERIERAAVLKDGLVYDVDRPGRHREAILRACTELGLDHIGQHEQGFVTTSGRFVRRVAAARIAYRAGQLGAPITRALGLLSEDLW